MIQMHVTNDKHTNIQNAVRLIRTCVTRYNPKVVVLPENFVCLYGKRWYEDYAEFIPNGDICTTFSTLCRDLKIYLVAGSIPERCEKTKMLFNTCMVFSPSGTMICKHRKIHLTKFELDDEYHIREVDILKAGDTLTTFDVDGVKIGLGIGYDMSFGELATLYRRKGCHMLIYPANYPKYLGELHWDMLTRTRAIDNQMYVVGVSCARDDTHDFVCYGHSMLVDPKGKVLVRAFDREEILYCDLDFTVLDTFRDQIKLWTHKRDDIYDTMLLN